MRAREIFFSLIVILLVTPVLTHSQTPTAVMLSCSGDVMIVRDGQTIKGAFGLNLRPGDEIRTGQDSQAEIHFDGGNWVRIGSNSSMQVKGQPQAKPEEPPAGVSMGTKSFQTVQNFIKLKNSEGSSSLVRLRSGEKHPELRAESPRHTMVRGRPTFRWSVSDPSTELKLTVYDEDGVYWQHEVLDTMALTYPADAPPLAPGTAYSWTLETTDPLKFPPLRSQAAFFEILSTEDDEELQNALGEIAREGESSVSAVHLVRASLFFEYNLLDEAIAETQRAIAVDPENPALRSILARLYAQTGRSAEALDEYDKILEK
ncbi:MAG: tetratricopeptide repeat protein [Candidatus Latescibacterota bacterium]|nr:MAG: tetratricopeptide repeat protein [Candidatus Latescibacterota bacterium]